jgi:VanZ family protein
MIQESQRKRILIWLPAVAWAAIIFLLSAQPQATFEKLGLTDEFLSVAAHFVVYAVLMTLVSLALRHGSDRPRKDIYLLAFVLVALYAISDELHQSFVPGRHTTVSDWLVDLLGAGLAWLLLARQEMRQAIGQSDRHD